MKVIYVSGGITNYKNNNKDNFNKKTEELRDLGNCVINPIEISIEVEKRLFKGEAKRKDYLKEDIKYLIICDYIYFLKGWSKSKGAILEYLISKELDIKMIFEDNNETIPDIDILLESIYEKYNRQLYGAITKELKDLMGIK